MGFRDDVVVRVRAETDGARIDARSSSRYGTFDFGTNASRIRGLINDIEDAIRGQKPERPADADAGQESADQEGSAQTTAIRVIANRSDHDRSERDQGSR